MSRAEMLKVRKSLSIDGALWKRAAEEAKRRDLSISQIICRALRRYMNQMDELNRLRDKND